MIRFGLAEHLIAFFSVLAKLSKRRLCSN